MKNRIEKKHTLKILMDLGFDGMTILDEEFNNFEEAKRWIELPERKGKCFYIIKIYYQYEN